MQLTGVQLFSVVLVLVLALLPSLFLAKKVKTEADYSLAGRSAGSALVAGTIVGTVVGGAATIGTAQLGYQVGISAVWFTVGCCIALLLMGLFYARPLRDSGLTTIAEFLVISYGEKAGPLTSIAATVGIFFSIVASMLTAMHMIAAVLSVSLVTAGILIILFVLLAVLRGGISGSGIQGLVKVAMVFATIFVSGIYAYADMGGIARAQVELPSVPYLDVFHGGFSTIFYSVFSLVIGIISTQTYVQALFSAKDSRTAVTGCMTAAAIVIPVGIPSTIIGVAVRMSDPGINSIDALPVYLLKYMPEWLGGAGVGVLIFAVLGSISGLVLGCSTMLTTDICRDLLHIGKEKLLWLNRAFVLVIAVVAQIFVFYHADSFVLDWTYLSMALRGAGIFLPLTFAIFIGSRMPNMLGLASMTAGILTAIFWKAFFPESTVSLWASMAANLFFLVSGALWVVFSRAKADG